jgi:hypothetical protein
LTALESEADFLFIKSSSEGIQYQSCIKNREKSTEKKFCTADRYIHFFLSLNKKFNLPHENLILDSVFNFNGENNQSESINIYKYLGENLMNLLNSESK